MAVPKQRKTKSRRDQRRMHLHVEKPSLVSCPRCGKLVRPHSVCFNCGFYKGEQVIDVTKKMTKKEKKAKEKEMEEKEKEEKKQGKGSMSWEGLSKK